MVLVHRGVEPSAGGKQRLAARTRAEGSQSLRICEVLRAPSVGDYAVVQFIANAHSFTRNTTMNEGCCARRGDRNSHET